MTTEPTQIVDAIEIDQPAGSCRLTISDRLEWDEDHLLGLQEKINLYLRFIESGEIYLAYPAAAGCDFLIDARFLYRPTAPAASFLEQAQNVLEEAGFTFRFGPLDAHYKDGNG